MDLRDADALRDLRLAEALEVRQPEQQPLPVVEDMEAVPEENPVLAEFVAVLEGTVAVELAVLTVDGFGDPRSQRRVELLEAARYPNGPGAVAQVALDLAVDRRNRVGGEIDPAVELKPVDRLDQPDRPHLDEIVELLTVPDVATRQTPHEREILLDQARPGAEVSMAVVVAQQRTDVGVA